METDLADEKYATEVVSYLLSSFPQQAPDPEIYGSQLIALCCGRSKAVLKMMVNPVDGLLGKTEFLPAIATVKKWLDRYGPRQEPVREYPLLPSLVDKPVEDPAVKDAAVAKWEVQRKRQKARINESKLTWNQQHDPEALIAALNANPELRKKG